MLKSFTLFTIISSAFAQVPYIFGGNNATQGQFPYFGSLRYILNSAEVHGCGASILNTRWALTAAHCTDYDPSSIDELNMVVGTITLSDPGTRYKIIDIINHPSYDAEKIINDISLVQTDRQIRFNEFVQPISIERVNNLMNDIATFAAFGSSEETDLSWQFWTERMLYVKLKIMDDLKCANRVSELYKNGEIPFLPLMMNQICTEAPDNAGVCFGDSGSGLVVNDKLVGVASFILGSCPSGFPEFFTRVSSFADWIDSHVGDSLNSANRFHIKILFIAILAKIII